MTPFCCRQRGQISSKGFDERSQRWSVLLPAVKRKLLLEAKLVVIDTSRPHVNHSVLLRPSVKALLEEIAVQQVTFKSNRQTQTLPPKFQTSNP